MEEYEFEFTGYMKFENEKEAIEFAWKMGKALGFLTKDNLNLYSTGIRGQEIWKNRIKS